ncbi:MAG: sodium ion-translocating decarboxylase subunit beta [Oscillospiraceae bacterium]|nr:sodium ion-translocating decarboxylase subunit beta [Oscillospiraceae bacterium]
MAIVEFVTAGLSQMTVSRGVMVIIALGLMYLAVSKKFEPLLLLPLSFGMLMANIPGANLSAYDTYTVLIEGQEIIRPGLMNFLYGGIVNVIYPPMIFLCIGSMTDFGPLISSPKSVLIGIGGQFGIFVAFGLALLLGNVLSPHISGFDGFTLKEAASIGVIGGSDGPTSIYTAVRLAPDLLASISLAAFSYMALVPFIQPPIMRALTTDKERVIKMPEPKRVTKKQKILFPIIMAIIVLLVVPTAGVLVGMFMLGNLIRESGVTERFVRTLQNDFLNILTILVGLSIGSSATAEYFLTVKTLLIIFLGLVAFSMGTVGGMLVAKLLCKITGGKVNPLIGNSGVSAMPMAARISQKVGQQYNKDNHLLMHAMGPLVSSTVGSAVVAGIFLQLFG